MTADETPIVMTIGTLHKLIRDTLIAGVSACDDAWLDHYPNEPQADDWQTPEQFVDDYIEEQRRNTALAQEAANNEG